MRQDSADWVAIVIRNRVVESGTRGCGSFAEARDDVDPPSRLMCTGQIREMGPGCAVAWRPEMDRGGNALIQPEPV